MEPRDGTANRQPGGLKADPQFRELTDELRGQSGKQIDRLVDWVGEHVEEDDGDGESEKGGEEGA